MSAETLRRAAALMRERVEDYRDAVNIDPQNTGGMHAWWTPSFIETAFQGHPSVELDAPGVRESLAAGAEHLAAWRPAVALAAAGLLSHHAAGSPCEGCGATDGHCISVIRGGAAMCCPECEHDRPVRTFARTYLGEVSR